MTQYKVVVDCSTKTHEYIPLTPEEIAEREQQAAAFAAQQAEEEAAKQAAAAAKQAAQDKLKALGLTDIEVAALVGA